MTMTEDTRMNLTSEDVTEERTAALRELYPEAFTEGKVDFGKLKQALKDFTDEHPERYGLSWAGKSEAIRAIQTQSAGTLVPMRGESVEFDTTEHLFIEGDNLEVLKLLQKSYHRKVKLIYIDPPYNTGGELIYPDNFHEGLADYLRYSGQVDDGGIRLSTNTETSGRFHSKWLSMMYPRLFLARNLLREDGVIFISIDDHEVHNLRLLMNEVFGEENFTACIANVSNPKGRSDDKYVATAHEYLLVYKKGDVKLRGWEPEENILRRYNKVDAHGQRYRELDLRKTGDNDRREDRTNLFYYFIYNPTTGDFRATREELVPVGYVQITPIREDGSEGNWRWELDTSNSRLERLIPKIMPTRKVWTVYEKDYLDPEERVKPTTAWTKKEFNSERGSEQFIELGFDKRVFPRPKPVGLLRRIIEMSMEPSADDIVLDFFAGSGTTAHAVLEMNREDGGNRHFILVQLPEPTPEDSIAKRDGFNTIADICKERVRRVLERQNEDRTARLDLDTENITDNGFRVYKLTSSNFKLWNANEAPKDSEPLADQLRLYADHLEPGRTQEDVLYEMLLNAGLSLSTKIEENEVAGQKVFAVAEGLLLICLEKKIKTETLRGMMVLDPQMVLCLDHAFADNDQLKTNIVLEMRSHDIKFHTV